MAAGLLCEAAVRISVPLGSLATFRDYLVANLRHHHESEDAWLWPRLLKAVPSMAQELDALSGEHERLDAALDGLAAVALSESTDDGHDGADTEARTRLHAAAAVVRDSVRDHLDHEEPLLIPALRAHIGPPEWDDFAQRVMVTTPTVAGHLTIGLLDEVGTPGEVEWMLGGLPEPVRPMLPDMRRQAAHDLRVLRGVESWPPKPSDGRMD